MEYLFDLDKPYFAAWLQIHDIDMNLKTESSSHFGFNVYTVSGVTPLYLATLCGFRDLVEHLVIKYPRHVNTSGGHFAMPLVAALARRHFKTAKLLLHNGAHVNVCGDDGKNPLHSAVSCGDIEMVWVLLNYKADVNAQDG